MPATQTRFEPTEFSVEEIRFLLGALGKKPPIVIRDMVLPTGVTRAQIMPLVLQCQELEDLLHHTGVPWAGYDYVQDAMERTLIWYQTCGELARRGGPKHASMQTWDGNRYLRSGPESDSGIVRTEILPDGSRRPLGVDLQSPSGQRVGPNLVGAAPWLQPGSGTMQDALASTPSALIVQDNEAARTGTVTCPICEWVESYSLQKARSKNMALNRMKGHLKRTKTQKDKHSILYGRVTGKSVAA
jgi:hypothetical protein